MATFTLDAIRQAADAKYGSTDIDLGDGTTVILRNPLRLSKEERTELASLQDNLDTEDEGVDQADVLADAIRLVAKDKRPVEKLIKLIDGDLALLAQVFESYSAGTQVGEA
ncbi:phage tail assembly protein [Streptodolium elevatio]|uniref:Phage tail assembly protein n=1 Tax=Streptodolium elevatio TaxID=3157996 RepID=A0ABV3DC10_9ACTN